MAYTKLFSTIVTSSIWTEDDKTRIVWITMLAIADKNGEVQASIPGLARVAGVSVVDTQRAIDRFLSPDPYSRTPDDEGRRLEKIEGGWSLLNYSKYRAMASKDEQKTANAERQRRHRDKLRRNGTVTQSNGNVTPSNATVTQDRDIAEAEAEAEAERDPEIKGKGRSISVGDTALANAIYKAYPRKQGRKAAVAKILAALADHSAEALMDATKAYAHATAAWPDDERQFIPHPATWFHQERFLDDRSTWQRKPRGGNPADHRAAKAAREFATNNEPLPAL